MRKEGSAPPYRPGRRTLFATASSNWFQSSSRRRLRSEVISACE
jgi:hypothetical protein